MTQAISNIKPTSNAVVQSEDHSKEKMISSVVEFHLRHMSAMSQLEKSALDILLEVFGLSGNFNVKILQLIGDYFSADKMSHVLIYLNLPRFVQLNAPDVLKRYLTNEHHLAEALNVLSRIYEGDRRALSQGNYGHVFPMNPEIWAFAMRMARDEIVVELGGAHGDNGILLAFSGAKVVCVNDVLEPEMAAFETTRKSLPKEIAQKLAPIPGSCFEILDKKPSLSKKVGLVLSRNLFHLFNSIDDQVTFCSLLKQMLKPGGRAIITANSVYNSADDRTLVQKHPDLATFSSTQGLIFSGEKAISCFYSKQLPCSEDQFSFESSTNYVYRKKLGGKWEVDKDDFKKLDPVLRKKIMTAFKATREKEGNKVGIKSISAGSVRVFRSPIRLYSIKTLSDFFKHQGFEVEMGFITAVNGHLIQVDDPFSLWTEKTPNAQKPQSVGVIVRYDGDKT